MQQLENPESATRLRPRGGARRRGVLARAAAVGVGMLVAASCSSTSSTLPGSPATQGTTARAAAPGSQPRAVPTRSPGCDASASAAPRATGEATEETMTSGGAARTYWRFIPSAPDAKQPKPLVVDLHGYSEGSAVHTVMSNLDALAQEKGFVVVTPQGTGQIAFWNAVPREDGPADVQFLSDLIDRVGTELCIDPSRVYVTGLSNGAFMSSLVACRLADKVAAVAPVAGLRFPKDCAPSRPVPIVAFHGTADEFVTYDGRPGADVGQLEFNDETARAFEGLTFDPIPDSLASWARIEGCAMPAVEERVAASVTLTSYRGCRDGSVVELYLVEAGGHAWPGSEFSASIERVVGPTTFEIDANRLMWAFFERHRLGSVAAPG